MPEYLAPGVFVEEMDSGSKPIEGVGVNTAAFVGYAKSGDFNKPTFITNWTQFCQLFGEEENTLVRYLCDQLSMNVKQVQDAMKKSRKGWTQFAADTLRQTARDAAEKAGKSPADVKKAGDEAEKKFVDFLRTSKEQDASFGMPYIPGSYLAHSVRGYFDNGGGRAYIIRMAHDRDVKALSYGAKNGSNGAASDAPRRVEAKAAAITAGPLLITAAAPGKAGNSIEVKVEKANNNNDEFRFKIKEGSKPEVTLPDGGGSFTMKTVADELKKAKAAVEVQVLDPQATSPLFDKFKLLDGADESNLPATTSGGAPAKSPSGNGLALPVADDFEGDEARRTGLGGLYPLEDVNFICAPDLMAELYQRGDDGEEYPVDNLDDLKPSIMTNQFALVKICERMGDRMAILDPLPGMNPQQSYDYIVNDAKAFGCDKGQATFYYPWIKVADPINKGRQMLCPPSGHMAGVWARVGTERGVHKAPANEVVLGAVDLELEITKGEQELLNPEGINCIRAFPGRGIRVWGARTLASRGNASWKYVNVRRLFNYLEKSLERSMQWVVFEPNDEDLWGRVRRNISAFLFTEWKEGKLFGSTPSEAYYVKCDRETNPQAMIDLGRLYVEIGVNPVKPAEFVIIRIGQWSGGSEVGEQ